MKFDPNADFETNINEALKELDDKELAETLRERLADIVKLADSSSTVMREPIIEDLQRLIIRRIGKGE